MTQYPFNTALENAVASSMPTMNQEVTMSPGFNVPRDFASSTTLDMSPTNVAGMSPHVSPGMATNMFAPGPFVMGGYHSRNGSDAHVQQVSPRYMHTALPIHGSAPGSRLNSRVSPTASDQSAMSNMNMSFGTGLPGVPGSLNGTPMNRTDSSATDSSDFMVNAHMLQASGHQKKRVTSDSILAQYTDVTTHLLEDEVKKEKLARKNSAGGGPKRKRNPRNTNLSAEAKEVRKCQNREAQRAYRERKDNIIDALKEAVKDLSERASLAENRAADLQELLQAERLANVHARASFASATHAAAPSPSTINPSMDQAMIQSLSNINPVGQGTFDNTALVDFNTMPGTGFQTSGVDFNNTFMDHN